MYVLVPTIELHDIIMFVFQSSDGSGSMELESRAILSRGRSIHHGLHFLTIMCNYSWAPVSHNETVFSVFKMHKLRF